MSNLIIKLLDLLNSLIQAEQQPQYPPCWSYSNPFEEHCSTVTYLHLTREQMSLIQTAANDKANKLANNNTIVSRNFIAQFLTVQLQMLFNYHCFYIKFYCITSLCFLNVFEFDFMKTSASKHTYFDTLT